MAPAGRQRRPRPGAAGCGQSAGDREDPPTTRASSRRQGSRRDPSAVIQEALPATEVAKAAKGEAGNHGEEEV
jgi:hypothetical protein